MTTACRVSTDQSSFKGASPSIFTKSYEDAEREEYDTVPSNHQRSSSECVLYLILSFMVSSFNVNDLILCRLCMHINISQFPELRYIPPPWLLSH